MNRHFKLTLLCLLSLGLFTPPANAGARYARKDFTIASEVKPRVVVVRPNIFVGTLDSQGRQIADPEWQQLTHFNLQESLKKHAIAKSIDLRFADWNDTASQPLSEIVWGVAGNINSDLIFKLPQGTSPFDPATDWQTQLKSIPKGYYEYAFPANAIEEIRQKEGDAEYALLINMHDAFTTDGAKLARFLGGAANIMKDGVNAMPLPPHHGFSMLVDLRDGRVLWFYNDGAFGGDLRKSDSADKRVKQMLTKFPTAR